MNRIKMALVFVMFLSGNAVLGTHGLWCRQQVTKRKKNAYKVRVAAAKAEEKKTGIIHLKTNGDLERYKDKRGSYSKALSHQIDGMVFQPSFHSMIKALKPIPSTHGFIVVHPCHPLPLSTVAKSCIP